MNRGIEMFLGIGEFVGLERQQSLADAWTLYTAVNGQYGGKNLSSAERFYLGGPTGVRAQIAPRGSAPW